MSPWDAFYAQLSAEFTGDGLIQTAYTLASFVIGMTIIYHVAKRVAWSIVNTGKNQL